MKVFTFIFLSLVVCLGCSSQHFVRGSGDASHFVLRQAIAHGARPVSTNSLPSLGLQWRYFQDQYGVIVYLPRDQFSVVETFLHQAFGEPSMPADVTTDGGRLGVYGVAAIGAGIQFGYDKDKAFVNILRPISTKELIEHLPEAMNEFQKSH